MRLSLRDLILGIGFCVVALTAGCKVGQDDIDTWKGTVKGPGKMVAVVLADKYDLQLRAYAALALVDMERHDVDGVVELLNALQSLDAGTRDKLIEALTPGLVQLMNAPAAAPAAGATPENAIQGPPPAIGAHDLEALSDWGFSENEIGALRSAGALA